MSTNNQNVVRRPPRTTNTKPSETSKIKRDDKKKKDQTTSQLKSDAKTTKLQQAKSNLNALKPAIANKNSSSASGSSKTSSTDSSRTKKPSTPTSSRVTTTQFFPTKQMYSKAIKQSLLDETANKNRERNKTRVLSPSEVKVLKQDSLGSSSERPRTATIKRAAAPPQQTEDKSYEDDFDSYESDFEAYTSSDVSSIANDVSSDDTSAIESPRKGQFTESDEDRKLDSGNYDLTEYKHKQVLDNIKESTERSNFASLSDEGFEEGRSLDKTSNQFVNFIDAQKKHNHLKHLQQKRKRGEEILSMIRLDNQTFILFEIPAVPYEVFIKKYGNNNAIQTAVQTGDDDVAEETQTDVIENVNKWTQVPVTFSKYDESDTNFMAKYKMEFLGVGTDLISKDEMLDLDVNYNCLLQTSSTVLTLLDEQSQRICKDIEINSANVPFSSGYIQFNTNLSLIRERTVDFVSFSTSTFKFLTVHTSNVSDLKTIICIWKVSNPNEPDLMLASYGHVTCSCFGDDTNLIFAGLSDGTIATWDTNENSDVSRETKLKLNGFSTNISYGHTSTIASIQSVTEDAANLLNGNVIRQSFNSQVYTLDEEGTLIIWSVIILRKRHCRTVSLVTNLKISLREEYPNLTNLQCTHMSVNSLDLNHVFVSTNYGLILHFITSGAKPNPKKYGVVGSLSQSNCISTCPLSPFYFLSGCQNGSVVLFSRTMEKPLMTMSSGEEYRKESGIEFVEWAYNKPCVFYTKDGDNKVHIWDLALSDIFPVCTIPFKEKINFMKLSPLDSKDNSNTKSYLIIVTNDNTIKLHILNKEHGPQTQEEYGENIKKFLNYVNRL